MSNATVTRITSTPPKTHLKDIAGQRFGRWAVIRRDGSDARGQSMWFCRCECGIERRVLGASLRSGKSISCGCWNRERTSATTRTHGEGHGSPEFLTWCTMRRRCSDPMFKGWKNYGGRGIKVCERWNNSYEAFLTDMGRKPSPAHSIDRIDNDGNYEPGNVRRATAGMQSINKRNVKNARGFYKRGNSYRVGINRNGRWTSIGSFTSEADARAAYLAAKDDRANGRDPTDEETDR